MLQYVIPHQEVMTHIDVGDDNSTPEHNMLRTDRIELSQAFCLAGFAATDAVRSLSVRFAVWTILHRLQPRSSLGLVADFFYLLNSLGTTGCSFDACRT